MERQEVDSSNVASVGYEDGILEVEFKGVSVYRYFDVPPELYEELKEADSVGSFIHRRIVRVFEHVRIN